VVRRAIAYTTYQRCGVVDPHGESEPESASGSDSGPRDQHVGAMADGTPFGILIGVEVYVFVH